MQVIRGGTLPVSREGAAQVRVLMRAEEGPADLTITRVDLDPGSSTSEHRHDSDQIVYILEGEGLFTASGEDHRLVAGDLIFIPAHQLHRHESVGKEPLRQLSLFIPPQG